MLQSTLIKLKVKIMIFADYAVQDIGTKLKEQNRHGHTKAPWFIELPYHLPSSLLLEIESLIELMKS